MTQVRIERFADLVGIVEPTTRRDGALLCLITSPDVRLIPDTTCEFRFDSRMDNESEGVFPGYFILPDGTQLRARRELMANRQRGETLTDVADRVGLDETAFLP